MNRAKIVVLQQKTKTGWIGITFIVKNKQIN